MAEHIITPEENQKAASMLTPEEKKLSDKRLSEYLDVPSRGSFEYTDPKTGIMMSFKTKQELADYLAANKA